MRLLVLKFGRSRISLTSTILFSGALGFGLLCSNADQVNIEYFTLNYFATLRFPNKETGFMIIYDGKVKI